LPLPLKGAYLHHLWHVNPTLASIYRIKHSDALSKNNLTKIVKNFPEDVVDIVEDEKMKKILKALMTRE